MVSTRQMTITTGPVEEVFTTLGTKMPSTSTASIVEHKVKQTELLNLPVEILDKIFSYTGYKKIGQMRTLSRQMNSICSGILNSTFNRLQTQLQHRFQTVKNKMPRRESVRRNHPLACECDIIETCNMRLSLLQMTFGKHIERKHCCFFPGGILDEVYNVLNYIRNTPKLGRPYKVTDELFDLSTMAMEYFKDHIENTLPDIAFFNSKEFISFKATLDPDSSMSRDSGSSSLPSPPQSNMVLRKGIRKIKQGMKRYNNQLSVLRSELRSCKRKATEQAKQISDQQKLLAEQQKQTLEYANRLDANDKKNEEMSRKFSSLLQESNKCKTELQYWRSKSPATPVCTSCNQTIPFEDIQGILNLGIKSEEIDPEAEEDENEENDIVSTDSPATQHQVLEENLISPPKTNGGKRKMDEVTAGASDSKKIKRVQNKMRRRMNNSLVSTK